MKQIIIATFALILFSCSSKHEGFVCLENDHYYRLNTFSEDTLTVTPNSLVQFQWTILDEQNTVVFQDRMFLRIDSIHEKSGLKYCLQQMKQGENSTFIFEPTYIENRFNEKLTGAGVSMKTGRQFQHNLIIDKIFTEQNYLAEKKKFLDWISTLSPVNFNSIENQVIDNYTSRNNLNMDCSATGLRSQIFKTNSGITTGFGKKVKISYKGGTLNKPEEHIAVTQDFYLGQELQVIKAIDEVLLMLEQGDSAIIIAPSNIAFGPNGSSTGLIPPETPVFYSIKLLESL